MTDIAARKVLLRYEVDQLGRRADMRWTKARKTAVAQAVAFGAVTAQSVCERFQMSAEELNGWVKRFGSK